jgi:hypothetical protein
MGRQGACRYGPRAGSRYALGSGGATPPAGQKEKGRLQVYPKRFEAEQKDRKQAQNKKAARQKEQVRQA